MKNIYKNKQLSQLVLFLGIFYGVVSCESALDEKIYSFAAKENFYKNADDAESAVVGIYSNLQNQIYDRWFWVMTELGSDQGIIHRNPAFLEMDDFNYSTDNIFLSDFWFAHYSAINRCNVVINRVPEIDMDEATKKIYVAEAKFVRANMYFNLVRLWGSVPFSIEEISDEESANIPKAPVDEIYNSIIADLKEAEEILPTKRDDNKFGRATQGAAKAMLTDVLLTTENWSEAAAKAKELIDTNRYTLLNSFPDIFSESNENNSEIIYSIAYDGINVANWMASFYHAGGSDNANCFLGAQVVQVEEKSEMWLNWSSRDLRKSFSVNDQYVSRADGTLKSVYNTARPYPAFTKWNAPDEIAVLGCPINFIVYRYADILLMYAEASTQANGSPTADAYNAFNKVRRRGYGEPINETSIFDLPVGLSASSFRDSIITERSHEFTAEAKRLFDLMRTNQFPQIIIDQGKNVRPGAKLFPIPQSEIDANTSLTESDQNEGY